MEILFIDACLRKNSRTRALATEVLNNLCGNITELKLPEIPIPVIDENAVDKRHSHSVTGDFDDPMFNLAKQFASSDEIVIAAPFWDMSFPAVLKQYIEAITVSGITFRYSEEGIPIGLCKAKNLYYVTTAGGPIFNSEFGFGYIKMLAENMYGIKNCHFFKAENLDIIGNNVDDILEKSKFCINQFFK